MATQIPASPFHKGEIAMQTSVGVAEKMEQFGGRVIRTFMPDQHRAFYAQLPFAVLGTVDEAGDCWGTLIAGQPGFIQSLDEVTLDVNIGPKPQDPAWAGMKDGAAVGILGIELHTRRRNRVNGSVRMSPTGGFSVTVEHAFGNCPQYIQLRDAEFVREPGAEDELPAADILTLADPRARTLIEAADTFFVTSYVEDEAGRHIDASHRGGKPGFVRINADGSLTIPDFAGNLFFNTLGNFLLNPKAGLVFPDFETGDLLQLTGDAEVVLESPDIAAFEGAERLWHFRPRRIVLRPAALPIRFTFQAEGWSPNSLMTGNWDQAQRRRDAEKLRDQWRPFRIVRIIEESSLIRSFHLEPADGLGVIAHKAGQHLPVRLRPDGSDELVQRTYTISTAPSDGFYRLSIKRDGLVSGHLHDHLDVGDIIEVRAPGGRFTIDPLERRPAVMLAAGVGITPILAMLRSIVFEGLRTRRVRPTYVFLAARTLTERGFDSEIADLVDKAAGAIRVIRVLGDPTGAEKGRDYDFSGRISADLLRAVLPFDGYDFYMCGPSGFMQSLYDALSDLGVADRHIHAESFGPASLTRKTAEPPEPLAPAATGPVPVAFIKSGKEARWTPAAGTLLELAEARGLTPEFGCRNGSCGRCAAKVVTGKVAYPVRPQADIEPGYALICCAVPAASSGVGTDRLILDL